MSDEIELLRLRHLLNGVRYHAERLCGCATADECLAALGRSAEGPVEALSEIEQAAIAYVAARDGGTDCWPEREALRNAVEKTQKKGR